MSIAVHPHPPPPHCSTPPPTTLHPSSFKYMKIDWRTAVSAVVVFNVSSALICWLSKIVVLFHS